MESRAEEVNFTKGGPFAFVLLPRRKETRLGGKVVFLHLASRLEEHLTPGNPNALIYSKGYIDLFSI